MSGDAFVGLYFGLCILWVGGIELWRAFLRRSRRSARRDEPDVCEFAVLTGGRRLAVAAAAASLRGSGAIAPVQRGRLSIVGDPPVDAAPIERELLDVLRRHPGITNRQLSRRVARGSAAWALIRRVVKGRLLVNPWVAGTAWLWMLPLIGLGIARLIAGHLDDPSKAFNPNADPTPALVILLVILTLRAIRLATQRHQLTRAGQELLSARRAEEQNWKTAAAHASPPMLVALFGASVLWTLDPAIASGWAAAPHTTQGQREVYYASVGRGPSR